jgi:SAM-dependent methyltransferase
MNVDAMYRFHGWVVDVKLNANELKADTVSIAAFNERNLISADSNTTLSSIGQPRFLVPPREDRPELLEQGIGMPEDVAINLAEMTRINRWLGGNPALTRYLYPLLLRSQVSQKLTTLIDLGGGSGDMARMITNWACRREINIRALPLDLELRNLLAASFHHGLQANALTLPFGDQSVDFFISSLFLHHLSPEQIIALLRETARCVRRAVVMSDLVRGSLPHIAFNLTRPVFARHPITFHDGLLSIRRAYRPDELLALACEAGLPQARVHLRFPWRMTLVIEQSEVSEPAHE